MMDIDKLFRWLSGVALMSALVACAAPPSPPPSVPAPRTPAATPAADGMTTLQSLIGEARCTSDAQCRTVAVGAKACGGPESYLAWSSSMTDEAALTAAAARHTDERRKANTASGRMSTCSMVVDPGAACTAGRCTLRGR